MDQTITIALDSQTNEVVETTEKRLDPTTYITDIQNQIDEKQKEIDGHNFTLQEEKDRTQKVQDEINGKITGLQSDIADLNKRIADAKSAGVVEPIVEAPVLVA